MKRILFFVLTAFIVFGASAVAATILNPSFEQPTTTSFIYNPTDPTGGWTFSGRSGVAANTFFNPPPPNGTQAAFLQQFVDQPSSLSSITQSVSGVTLVPSTLTFFIAQRPGNAPNPVVVTFGSQNLGTFTPSSTAFQLITVNFTPSSTSGVLQFQSAATTNGDLDTAIDQVSLGVSAVPEPAMYIPTALIGAGLMVFGRFRRRK